MAVVAVLAMVAGILLFILSMNVADEDKSLRNGSIIMAVGGLIGGCFGMPSSDMPDGNPAAITVGLAFIALGIFTMIKKFIFKKKNDGQEKKSNSKILLIIVGAVLFVMIIVAFASSQNAPNPNEPWKDLGVSKKEYMDVYNRYKYGE